jgi:dienelactone hydrolase
MTSDTSPAAIHLDVSPQHPSLDTELHIRINGMNQGGQLTLHAGMRDPRGREWRSQATFAAAEDGTVDLRRDAPRSGSYEDVDAMGLIWSMCPVEESDPGGAPDVLSPTPLVLRAELAGVEVARAEVLRSRVPDGLVREDVRDLGLVGTLYRPDTDARVPGVLMLGGAEGGMHEDDAALLAAHGFAVMALAYYGLPGLPPALRDVPVEYFGTALDLLRRHPAIDGHRIGIMGASKGGEAALLIGSMHADLRAVVSVVGSGLLTQGISQDVIGGSFVEIMTTPVATWTYQGRELPYLPNVLTERIQAALAADAPIALKWAMPDLWNDDPNPDVIIPVEQIRGAVLLVSGEDDQGYGMAAHEIAARRLAQAGTGSAWRHTVHAGAGHLIAAPPFGPTTRSTSPGPGVTFTHGGSPAADARARAATWREIVEFLTAELDGGAQEG